MFSWCRAQIKEYGGSVAARLICRVAWSRAKTNFANRFLPQTVECPCCGWRGRRFHDYIEAGYAVSNTMCPQCESQQRHRAFHFWLKNEFPLVEKKGVALVFAPERALASLWNSAEELRVIRVDITPERGIDLLADMTSLPIETDSIDLVWCHHVLEHIERDRAAISELCRVLRPDTGELIVSVPMELGTETREYGFANKLESGHWRIYGDDFADRLEESGLAVQTISYTLPSHEQAKYGVVPERFYRCRKIVRHG